MIRVKTRSEGNGWEQAEEGMESGRNSEVKSLLIRKQEIVEEAEEEQNSEQWQSRLDNK